ncbi:hypothetical protein TIFTF001_055698, partial [Ficus carica]
MPNKSLD